MTTRTIEKRYYEILIIDKVKIREAICMNVLNMKLNIGCFNIDINIGKNIKEIKDLCFESIKHQQRMKEELEDNKALSQNLLKYNIF